MSKELNEILNRGSAMNPMIGQKIGWFINRSLKMVFILLVVFALIGAGQIGQYSSSADDLTMKIIADWKIENPTQAHLADMYIEECLNAKYRHLNESIPLEEDGPISHYECGIDIGAESLVVEIKAANDILKTVAWPLSIIIQK